MTKFHVIVFIKLYKKCNSRTSLYCRASLQKAYKGRISHMWNITSSERCLYILAKLLWSEIRSLVGGDRNLSIALSYLTLRLPGPSAGVSGSLDSYCSLKSLGSGMGEVVPARTSPTLLHPSPRTVLSLSCFKVSQCINCRDWHCKS